MREIRKYANRRLYDVHTSKYIKLDDLREIITQGDSINVIDDPSGKNITHQILVQVLAEQEQLGQPILSKQVLEAIIRLYGHPLQQMATRYLEASTGQLEQQRKMFSDQVRQILDGMPFSAIGDITEHNLKLAQDWQKNFLDLFAAGPGADNTRKD